jgi:type II secretory pathway pseudopilin PulG
MHIASRRRAEAGFSFIEILVVMGIITLLASMVVVIIPIINERAARTKSQDNVKNIVIMMQALNTNISQWPPYNGKCFTLAPFAHGIHNADQPGALETFFSPSDAQYKAGAVEPADYKALTKQKLKAGEDFKRLTSYAGRRNGEGAEFVMTSADTSKKGLICFSDDDDGPLHHKAGVVVAFGNGSTEFITWGDLEGMSEPKNERAPDPFLGENASNELLKMLSSQ